ncbi:MAG: prepilin-type N-terminal cleavage/methylation domain-containing protein [Parvularculaceae bacterium]|nr:prepilin-type N-terminal cleavage/methylation domain-containing protein [Parvularculaceae bacterium]
MLNLTDFEHVKPQVVDRDTRGQRGFTVTEALVAVALIAIAMLPLLELQGRLSRSALAIERAQTRLAARQAATAYISLINPMRAGEGEVQLGGAQLVWRAVPLGPARTVYGADGTEGRFIAQLFQVEADIIFPDGRSEPFSQTQMGWIATAPASPF